MSHVADSAGTERGGVAGKYLTVSIADETYGIAVLKVREIIRLQRITPIPQTPDYVKGVINLRGRVIPIIDLRLKFGLPSDSTGRTCIVVVRVTFAQTAYLHLGLIVDGVEEVVTLGREDIEPTPEFGTQVDTSYLLGMATLQGRVKTLLDIDRVLLSDTVQQLATCG